jgi:hypothetical protein
MKEWRYPKYCEKSHNRNQDSCAGANPKYCRHSDNADSKACRPFHPHH